MLDKIRVMEFIKDRGVQLSEMNFFELTDSTNARAMERARAKNDRNPAIFIAREQSAGKGRRGRSFLSPEGGLYMSILVYPDGPTENFTKVTAFAAVALCRAIERCCGVRADIKWVNDLYINDKKLAGILTEGVFDSDGNLIAVVCGMGINVYKTPDSAAFLVQATSLSEHVDFIDINSLAAEISAEFILGCNRTDCRGSLEEYKKRSIVLGREIEVMTPCTESYTALARDILDDYSLLIEKNNGVTDRLFYGEVSLHLTQNKG